MHASAHDAFLVKAGTGADQCTECADCEPKCPQNIPSSRCWPKPTPTSLGSAGRSEKLICGGPHGKTRSLANLIQSARAFQESRVLLTALELDVFSTVGEGGATAADVAQRLGTEPRATEMLLNALVALARF